MQDSSSPCIDCGSGPAGPDVDTVTTDGAQAPTSLPNVPPHYSNDAFDDEFGMVHLANSSVRCLPTADLDAPAPVATGTVSGQAGGPVVPQAPGTDHTWRGAPNWLWVVVVVSAGALLPALFCVLLCVMRGTQCSTVQRDCAIWHPKIAPNKS